MAGTIEEFFGYRTTDTSTKAEESAAKRICPFLGSPCQKILARDRVPSGVCAIRQKGKDAPPVICCPNRLYAGNYALLRLVSKEAFGSDIALYAGRVAVSKAKDEGSAIAVFGHGWGGELRLPKRNGSGSYFVDWVLARLDGTGSLVDFTAIEVQTIDTTGSYGNARKALLAERKIIPDTVGLNWENVAKRIIPQIIYKGQVLQRENRCRTGLFFVTPKPIYTRILTRLGGLEKIPAFPTQPASIHFIAYDYAPSHIDKETVIRPLEIVARHSTTVYKVQEAFSSVSLPEANVYEKAILDALTPESP